MRARAFTVELLLVAASLSCKPAPQGTRRATAVSASSNLKALLAPRPASRFQAHAGKQRQEHPRLPDTGEWTCAERGGVVWCKGWQTAAGIVPGPPDASYRCGTRWQSGESERICIDQHPEYPTDEPWQCGFVQELGIARECSRSAPHPGLELPSDALPACWLDVDCPAGHCERGACSCRQANDCLQGRCDRGVCVEARR